jgi:hypothetical protein
MLRKWVLFTLLILGLLFNAQPVSADKNYSADRYDVNLVVMPDGSLQVTETVVLRFVGGPFTFVFRDISTTETDGISVQSASMDGQALPQGVKAGMVDIQPGSPVKVTWHFAPTSDSTHTFTLAYRATGVIRPLENDTLIWRVIPEEHEYNITHSTITLQPPAGINLVGAPTVDWPGASVEMEDRQAVIQAGITVANNSWVVTARFPRGSLAKSPPLWMARQLEQADQIRRAQPIALGSGLALIVLGVVALASLSQQFRRDPFSLPASVPASGQPQTRPPSDLAPALAASLVYPNSTGFNFMATFYDLARRGVIKVDETAGKWFGKDFVITRQESEASLMPHETAVMEILFTLNRKGPRTQVRMSDLANTLITQSRKYNDAVNAEMTRLGLLDNARQKARSSALVSAVFALLVGIALLVAGAIWAGVSSEASAWSQYTPAVTLVGAGVGLFIVSLAGLIYAASRSTLTLQGEQAASQWKSFVAYLKNIIRKREPSTGSDLFELYLPYTAAFGLVGGWAKYFQKAGGVQIPAWFHGLQSQASGGDFASFVAFTSSSSSSSDSGGGGGAG